MNTNSLTLCGLLLISTLAGRADLTINADSDFEDVSVNLAASGGIVTGTGSQSQNPATPGPISVTANQSVISPTTADSASAITQYTTDFVFAPEGLRQTGSGSTTVAITPVADNPSADSSLDTVGFFTPDVALPFSASLTSSAGSNAFLGIYDSTTNTQLFILNQSGTGSGTLPVGDLLSFTASLGVSVSGGAAHPEDPTSASSTFAYNLQVGSVPEPSTYALMLGGLAVLGFPIRRKVA